MIGFSLKTTSIAAVAVTAGLVLGGCTAQKFRPSSQISSNRSVETLVLEEGELPRWTKNGNLTLKSDGRAIKDPNVVKLSVDSSSEPQTIEGKDRDVVITGSNGDITIKGKCSYLIVTGQNNDIKCDKAAAIKVNGGKNQFNFDSLGTGTVKGDGNSVIWKNPYNAQAPQVVFEGINNTIEHQPIKPRYRQRL